MGFQPGDRIGDYEVVRELGAGGMGKVYRVRNLISEREEAMKVLLPNLAAEPDLADRFMREIRVQARLQHPNIASLNTAFRYENQLVMVMELVEGVTLQDRLRQGPLTLHETIDYTCQILRALSYAHKQGVIHRDIKPANMILTPGGTVKLLDFGIAKAVADRKLTQTGMTVGSLHYMSPEQIQGKEPDPRSDLYSVGVSLYQFATGHRPIEADSDFALMSAQMETVPRPPIELDPKIPKGLNEIILMTLKKRPEERFQSADALLGALESLQRSLEVPTSTVPASNPVPPPRPVAAPPVVPVNAPPVSEPVHEKPQRSYRAVYMMVGAVAAIAVIAVAAIQVPKWMGTHASEQMPPSAVQSPVRSPLQSPLQSPVQSPVQSSRQPSSSPAVTRDPVVSPAPGSSLAPPPQTQAVQLPATQNQPAQVMQAAPRETTPSSRPGTQASPIQAQVSQAASQQQTTPQQIKPAQMTPSAAPPQAVPQRATQAAAPPPVSSSRELEQVQENMTLINARMSGVNSSLAQLQQSQNAAGLSPNSDTVAAQQQMQSFFAQAETAVRNGDAAAAARYLARSEKSLEKLEKFLGR